jgi:glycosyltransferase involved in cell wall biosynthesis
MTDDKDKVSVVIRTKGGRPEMLAGAIRSVRDQTYPATELIVVEDGCKEAEHLVANLAGDMTVPPLHITADKNGRATTGNIGVSRASGAFVCFLDDDDELLPNHLSILTPKLTTSNGKTPAAYAGTIELRCAGDGSIQAQEVSFTPFSLDRLWQGNYLPIQSVLFRKQAWDAVGGFDPALAYLEDWDLWLRMAMLGDFADVDEVTSRYRVPAARQCRLARAKQHSEMVTQIRLRQRALAASLLPERTPSRLESLLSGRFDRRNDLKERLREAPMLRQIWPLLLHFRR